MKKGLVLAVTLAAFTLVGVVGCSPSAPDAKPAPKADAAKPASAAPAAPKADAAKPADPAKPADAAKPAEPSAAAPAPAPATTPAATPPAAPAAGALTAQTIVGTTWDAGGHTLLFNADGKLKVDGAIDGTWAIDGAKLNVEAAGQKMAADIAGDKIMFNGNALTKK